MVGLPFLSATTASASVLPARPAAGLGLMRVGAAPRLPEGARALGLARSSTVMRGAVALKPRDPAALAAYASAVTNPYSTLYKHYLRPGSFVTRFGPSSAAVHAVEAALRAGGLAVTGVASNHLLVDFSGSTARVSSAFHTSIEQVRLSTGRVALSNTAAPKLASALAPVVAGVIGLNNLVQQSSMLAPATKSPTSSRKAATAPADRSHSSPAGDGPVACTGALSAAANYQGITDSQLASAYGLTGLYSAGDVGTGQTVAIYELEPFLMSDISAFDKCYFPAGRPGGLPSVTAIDGGQPAGEGSGEAALDIENVSALAPGAAIDVYEAPNTLFGGVDEYNTIVSDDTARVVSTSWGLCEAELQEFEPGLQQIEDSIFQQAAIQGQTVFAAAGDDGSDDCGAHASSPTGPVLSVDDPASQPYVVGVGGTTMLSPTDRPDQVVWNDGAESGAGGGGISADWAMPSWQLNAATYLDVAANPYSTGSAASTYEACQAIPAHGGAGLTVPCREVPDVSAMADEYTGMTIYDAGDGGWTTIGGTSSATPIWASVLTEIDASSFCGSGKDPVGFASPALYGVASASQAEYAASFDTITTGDNDIFGATNGAFEANPSGGYSMAAGLGTPNVTNAGVTSGVGQGLAYNLCTYAAPTSSRPTVTGLTNSTTPADANSGPLSGGNVVTITGTGLAGATTVEFGTTSVSGSAITSDTATSLSVTAPARYLDPTSFENGGGVAVTVTTPAGTSAPNPSSEYVYVSAPSGTATPVVDGVSPYGGSMAGGFATGTTTAGSGPVIIYGSGFTGATSVTFGGVPLASGSYTINATGTQIAVTAVPAYSSATTCATGTPLSDVCQVEVVVTSPSGASPQAKILPPSGSTVDSVVPAAEETTPAATEYDYYGAPVISSVTEYGSQYGDLETITGTGFDSLGTEFVNIGPPTATSSQSPGVVTNTSTSMTFETPALPKLLTTGPTLPVTLQTMAGLSNAVNYTYAGNPVLDSLSVDVGPTTGSQTLTIKGAGFTGLGGAGDGEFTDPAIAFVAQDFFDVTSTVYISNIVSSTPTSITLRTPAGLPGPNDVLVCTTTNCTIPNPAVDTYTYAYPGIPTVQAAVNPATGAAVTSGPAEGGNTVVLIGTNLSGATGVSFGPTPATTFANVANLLPSGNPTELEVTVPPGIARTTVPITVTTNGGTDGVPVTSTTSGAPTYTYTPSAPSAPSALSVRGGAGVVLASFQPSLTGGGSPITKYVATATSPGLSSSSETIAAVDTGQVTTAVLLAVPGHKYSVTVRAYNSMGAGLPAMSAKPVVPSLGANGYLLATSGGAVEGFGSLRSLGGTGGVAIPSRIVAMALTPDGLGYWLVAASGKIYNFGDAPALAIPPSIHHAPIVAAAATPSGKGLWLVNTYGVVYPLGNASSYGELGQAYTTSPVVGIAPTPSGKGYYLVTQSGAVTPFGDAHFYGTAANLHLTSPVVGIALDSSGGGYWLTLANGSVFGFGNAGYYGSAYSATMMRSIVGIVATPVGSGYWLIGLNGAVYRFGDAVYEGSGRRTIESPAAAGVA